MKPNQYQKQQLQILQSQLIGCIFYIASIVISIIIIINQQKKILKEKELLTDTQEHNLAIINKVLILLLTIFFLYLNYESLKLTKQVEKETKLIKLLIIGSYLSIIIAIIGLWVVIDADANSISETEAQNP